MTTKIFAASRLALAFSAEDSFTLKYLYRIYHNQKLKKKGEGLFAGDIPKEIADKMHVFLDSNGFKKVGSTYKGHDEEVKMTPGRMEGQITIAVKTKGNYGNNQGSSMTLHDKF